LFGHGKQKNAFFAEASDGEIKKPVDNSAQRNTKKSTKYTGIRSRCTLRNYLEGYKINKLAMLGITGAWKLTVLLKRGGCMVNRGNRSRALITWYTTMKITKHSISWSMKLNYIKRPVSSVIIGLPFYPFGIIFFCYY